MYGYCHRSIVAIVVSASLLPDIDQVLFCFSYPPVSLECGDPWLVGWRGHFVEANPFVRVESTFLLDAGVCCSAKNVQRAITNIDPQACQCSGKSYCKSCISYEKKPRDCFHQTCD